MRLSDVDIEFYRRTGHLNVTPWDDASLQGASYDLHLAPYVAEPFRNYQVNAECQVCVDETYWVKSKFEEEVVNVDYETGFGHLTGELVYILAPNAFVLMSTIETVEVSTHLSSAVAGKSSRAREGIAVEFAGWVDPGFMGNLTLEVKNNLPFPIRMTAGMPIAQVIFELLRTPSQRPYGARGHYMGQSGPTPSWKSR